MRNKTIILLFAAVFSLSLISGLSFADTHGKSAGYDKGLDSKICQKVQFIMKNQEELKITDEQIKKLKDLKRETKKEMIKKEAEIEVIAVDVKSMLYEDTVDAEAINKLIDQKYEVKKAKAKYLVNAYAKLKNILTKEQKDAMKKLWYKSESKCSAKCR